MSVRYQITATVDVWPVGESFLNGRNEDRQGIWTRELRRAMSKKRSEQDIAITDEMLERMPVDVQVVMHDPRTGRKLKDAYIDVYRGSIIDGLIDAHVTNRRELVTIKSLKVNHSPSDKLKGCTSVTVEWRDA